MLLENYQNCILIKQDVMIALFAKNTPFWTKSTESYIVNKLQDLIK